MDTAQESVCCKEINKINDLLVGDPLPEAFGDVSMLTSGNKTTT